MVQYKATHNFFINIPQCEFNAKLAITYRKENEYQYNYVFTKLLSEFSTRTPSSIVIYPDSLVSYSASYYYSFLDTINQTVELLTYSIS